MYVRTGVASAASVVVKREKVDEKKKKKKKKKKKSFFFSLSSGADRKAHSKHKETSHTKHHSRLIQGQRQMHHKRVQHIAVKRRRKSVGDRQIGARLNRVDCAV
jgi:hypothetical protein